MEEVIINHLHRRYCLRFALAKLPNDYQRMIVILRLLGYREKEIAPVCGVSRQYVGQVYREFKRRNGLQYFETN